VRTVGPPQPFLTTGPSCEGCPYRGTSLGYAPHSGSLNSSFLFLLEALGAHEIEASQNAVGPTGRVFDILLRENTTIKRSEQLVANTCRCWPVSVDEKGDFSTTTYSIEAKKLPVRLRERERMTKQGWVRFKTYVTQKPSPGQIRECASRYTDKLIESFTGKYIVALGKIPTSYMLSSNVGIQTKRGTIHVRGDFKFCTECKGKGEIPRKSIKCKSCKNGQLRCKECGRWKHLVQCQTRSNEKCALCNGLGEQPRSPKTCRECEGSGKVPVDPKNPFICERLKDNQILFPTFHPALMTHKPSMWALAARDFSRLETLEDEVNAKETLGDYQEEPPEEVKREVVYVS